MRDACPASLFVCLGPGRGPCLGRAAIAATIGRPAAAFGVNTGN